MRGDEEGGEPRSVVFDQVADRYDATRGLSPEAERAVTALLVAELDGRGRCLEAGVGTGRIALPLYRAGIPMAGVDLSAPMLARLVEKGGGRAPFSLARADATRLPFADAAFGAGLISHVLHLVPAWERLLAELVRTVRPGGVILATVGSYAGELEQLHRRVVAEAGIERPHVGLDHDTSALDSAMVARGARVRPLEPVPERREVSFARFLDAVASNLYSWTWRMDPTVLGPAVERTRAWAAAEHGPLDPPRQVEAEISWRAYDLP